MFAIGSVIVMGVYSLLVAVSPVTRDLGDARFTSCSCTGSSPRWASSRRHTRHSSNVVHSADDRNGCTGWHYAELRQAALTSGTCLGHGSVLLERKPR